jgi:hypothetical protein
MVIEEFREMMKRGGELDIGKLAQKFNIDVDMLREKVAEARKRRETGDPVGGPGPSEPTEDG